MQRNPVRLGEMNIVTDEMVLTLVGQHIEKAFYKIYLPFKNRITMGFINQQNYRYLCDGLTYESSDLEVLETVLNAYNEKTGHIDAIIKRK
ncbi:hypothetical protein QF042_003766 [Pedobacter sp. W3I1]|uniref:hypothetical protein n=1 Tax=Pedobacter sp. W3I1 TaxID=3042291 RepID=UPI00278891BF|nr:hypothetical protein [Pedobacter sp. W3I1]MDQ0640201.1 hypothetical protein [Pedobacter sp. W3I1]